MVASTPKVARLARGKAPIGLRPCREVLYEWARACLSAATSFLSRRRSDPCRRANTEGCRPRCCRAIANSRFRAFPEKQERYPTRLTEQKTYLQRVTKSRPHRVLQKFAHVRQSAAYRETADSEPWDSSRSTTASQRVTDSVRTWFAHRVDRAEV